MAQQPLIPLMYHGNHLQRGGGKWEESVAESTYKKITKCLDCFLAELERCIKNEIQMNCLLLNEWGGSCTIKQWLDTREKNSWLLPFLLSKWTLLCYSCDRLQPPLATTQHHPPATATTCHTSCHLWLKKLHQKHKTERMLPLLYQKVQVMTYHFANCMLKMKHHKKISC